MRRVPRNGLKTAQARSLLEYEQSFWNRLMTQLILHQQRPKFKKTIENKNTNAQTYRRTDNSDSKRRRLPLIFKKIHCEK